MCCEKVVVVPAWGGHLEGLVTLKRWSYQVHPNSKQQFGGCRRSNRKTSGDLLCVLTPEIQEILVDKLAEREVHSLSWLASLRRVLAASSRRHVATNDQGMTT